MNILDLPQELVIYVMLQLDPSHVVTCGQVSAVFIHHENPGFLQPRPLKIPYDDVPQVSRYFKALLDTTVIRYKFALAAAGMVDGTASGVPVKDRLLALGRYEKSWRAAEFVRDTNLIDDSSNYRCLPFTGSAVPIVQGSALKIAVPASPGRGIPAQVWSTDLKGIPS